MVLAEAKSYLDRLNEVRANLLKTLEGLDTDALNWTPLPNEANSLIVLAVPLFDLVAVSVRRWRRGVPVYVGDENHLSHRLVRLGLSRVAAVTILYALTLVLGLGAVVLMWAPLWVAAVVMAQTLGVLGIVTALKKRV